MSELQDVKQRLKNLILTNCNTIGCDKCGHKWEKDKDGNSCSSDYLVMMESDLSQSDPSPAKED